MWTSGYWTVSGTTSLPNKLNSTVLHLHLEAEKLLFVMSGNKVLPEVPVRQITDWWMDSSAGGRRLTYTKCLSNLKPLFPQQSAAKSSLSVFYRVLSVTQFVHWRIGVFRIHFLTYHQQISGKRFSQIIPVLKYRCTLTGLSFTISFLIFKHLWLHGLQHRPVGLLHWH